MIPAANQLLDQLHSQARRLGRTVRIMEVCGTHTVAIQRCGLRTLLPENVALVSGPGCPVCVTPAGIINVLVTLARRPEVLIATYGDLVRVPGGFGSLAGERAAGCDVRVVVSAFDAFKLAVANPGKQVVFAAVGFETTTPPTADIIRRAAAEHVANLTAVIAHRLLIPALRALLASPDCAIDAFLCPGHVSIVIGADAYRCIAAEHRRPCVIAGFEPIQMIDALARIVTQLAAGEARVENAYPAVVRPEPLASARRLVEEVFEPADSEWRALGTIRRSGLALRPQYASFDAVRRFGITVPTRADPPGCRCGSVIRGLLDPVDCSLFARQCTPIDPVGPCMISSEGACQAWYKYGNRE